LAASLTLLFPCGLRCAEKKAGERLMVLMHPVHVSEELKREVIEMMMISRAVRESMRDGGE